MKKIIISALMGLSLPLISCAHTDATAATASDDSSRPVRTGRLISQDDFVKAAEQTVNGVVSVKSFATPRQRSSRSATPFDDPLFEYFFGSPRRQQPSPRSQEPATPQQIGLGSGVIISDDGYIVTNNHVIAEADKLEVTLNDNRNFPATVVGADPDTDLALIKIDAPDDLHVIPMGDSEKLHVGEWVLAVGNPFGFTSTVTTGIVSAKARNISSSTGGRGSGGIESYIQTDAAVNQGNSGGALVNLDGELVGINAAIYSQTGAYAGCSFAIPVSIVQKVVKDLSDFGAVQRAYIGIRFAELTPELISELKIEGTTTGVYVHSTEDRSAAREAGIEEGDVIVSIGGKPTLSTAQLQEAVTSFSPGDKVVVEYYRDGKLNSCEMTLRNRQGDTSVTRAASAFNLGATFATVSNEQARALGIRGGVTVATVERDGRFARAGVRAGFVILGVNGERVGLAEQFESIYKAILQSGADTDKVLFLSGVYPDGKTAYYAVPLSE